MRIFSKNNSQWLFDEISSAGMIFCSDDEPHAAATDPQGKDATFFCTQS